jgi:hypothetical protein
VRQTANGKIKKGRKEERKQFESVVVTGNVPFGHVFCEEVEIGIPFVANDFPAREAANGDNLKMVVSQVLDYLLRKNS